MLRGLAASGGSANAYGETVQGNRSRFSAFRGGSCEKWQNFGKYSDNLCDDEDKDEPVNCWITVSRVPSCVRFYQFPPQNGRSGLGRVCEYSLSTLTRIP